MGGELGGATAEGLSWWPQDGAATSNSNQRQEKLNPPLPPRRPAVWGQLKWPLEQRRPQETTQGQRLHPSPPPVASTNCLHLSSPPITSYLSPLSRCLHPSPPPVASTYCLHQSPRPIASTCRLHSSSPPVTSHPSPPPVAHLPRLSGSSSHLGSGRVYLHLFPCA